MKKYLISPVRRVAQLLWLYGGVAAILVNCSNFADNITFDSVVLKTENNSFTYEEYCRYIDREIRILNLESLNEGNLIQIENRFRDFALLVDEAITHGYEENSEVIDMNESVAEQIILQPKGVLAEYLEKELPPVTDAMIDEAISKRRTRFTIEFIEFPSEYEFGIAARPGTHVLNVTEFEHLLKNSKKIPEVNTGTLNWNWLSRNFVEYREKLFTMNTGDISPTITRNHTIVIFRITGKNVIAENSDPNRDAVKRRIIELKRELSAYNFDKSMYQAAEIVLHHKNIQKFWDRIDSKELSTFDTTALKDIHDLKLMNYSNGREICTVTCLDFMVKYNKKVIRPTISLKRNLLYHLKDIAWKDHAVQYAESHGLFNDKTFLTDKKLHKMRVMVDLYLSSFVPEITDTEIMEEYETNASLYREVDSLSVSLLKYNSSVDAAAAIRFLAENRHYVENKKFESLPVSYKPVEIEYVNKLTPQNNYILDTKTDQLFNYYREVYPEPLRLRKRKYGAVVIHKRFNGVKKHLNTVRNSVMERIHQKKVSVIRLNILNKVQKNKKVYSEIESVRSLIRKQYDQKKPVLSSPI